MVITLRRDQERHHEQSRKREVWRTFSPQIQAESFANGFGTLEQLDEDRRSPGTAAPHKLCHDGEIVTYVREGALAYEDSAGVSGVVRAGEFHCMTAEHGIRETNASQIGWSTHVFQIWFRRSAAELEPAWEQKRFSVAQRRGTLCVVASPDARRGSLRIRQDALVYSALLDSGKHVAHEVASGRRAWLHLVQGEVTLGDVVLTTGDGAGFTAERAVSLTAREESEILLLDLGDDRAVSVPGFNLWIPVQDVAPGSFQDNASPHPER